MSEQVKFNPDLSIILIGSIINKSLMKYTGDFPDCKAIIPIDTFITDLNELAAQYTNTFNDVRFPKIDIKLLSFIISKTLYHRFVQIGQKEVVIDVVPHVYENMLKNIVATSTLRYSKYLWRNAKEMYEKDGNVVESSSEVPEEKEEEEEEEESGKMEVDEKVESKENEDKMDVDKVEEEATEDKTTSSEPEEAHQKEEETKDEEDEEQKGDKSIVESEKQDEAESEAEEEGEEANEEEKEEEEIESEEVKEEASSEAPEIKGNEEREVTEVKEEENKQDDEVELVESEENEEEEEEEEETSEKEEEKQEDSKEEKHVTIAKEDEVMEVKDSEPEDEDDEDDEQEEEDAQSPDSKEGTAEEDQITQKPGSRKRSRSPSAISQHKRFQNIAVKLITTIQEHRFSSPFLQAVNKRDAPDYYDTIYEPKDLKSILKAVKSKKEPPEYQSIKQLERDIMLMFANCIMYNKSDDDLVQLTISMKEEVRNIFKIFEEAEEEMK